MKFLSEGNINTNAMSTLQTIIIIITVVIFFGRLFFGVFKRFSPFDHAASNEQADFNVSDYNIVNIDTDASLNTENDTSNRVNINSSSEADTSGNGVIVMSSAEEGSSSPTTSKPPKVESEMRKSESNRELTKAKSSALSKTPRSVVSQSVRISNFAS